MFEAKLGRFARGSLHTRDDETADTRHLPMRAELSKLYAAVKAAPAPLSQRQVEALAGEIYRLIREHGANPGTVRQRESFKALTRAALAAGLVLETRAGAGYRHGRAVNTTSRSLGHFSL